MCETKGDLKLEELKNIKKLENLINFSLSNGHLSIAEASEITLRINSEKNIISKKTKENLLNIAKDEGFDGLVNAIEEKINENKLKIVSEVDVSKLPKNIDCKGKNKVTIIYQDENNSLGKLLGENEINITEKTFSIGGVNIEIPKNVNQIYFISNQDGILTIKSVDKDFKISYINFSNNLNNNI